MKKMRAVFSPGPSYSNPEVRKYAGWVKILDLYKEGLEELGHEVFIPRVDPELIDQSSTVSKILSYDVVAAWDIPDDIDLFLGPPGYSLAQMRALWSRKGSTSDFPRLITYVWNNADWYRDQQLAQEYGTFREPYDLSPTWRWINTTALLMCDHIIACSPWVKKTHQQVPGVTADKISMTPWGVDSRKFRLPTRQQPPGFNVLFVGGDWIRKGLIYLIKALDGLEGVELWIAGCIPALGMPTSMKVRVLGMVPHDEMLSVYQQCHVICIPTLEDGIALAIQEGMACGLVPITTPECAEVFDPGLEGIRVEYREVKGIRQVIESLRDNPDVLTRMSLAAWKRAGKDTWEKTKESFKEVIKAQCQ